MPVNRGATLVMAEKFSASRFFQHVGDHRVTVAAGNPTTINILLNAEGDAHRANLPSLRFITSSSAPLTVEEWRRFEERFGIPDRAGLRLERDRLDRRHPRRSSGGSAPSDGPCPITTWRSSTPTAGGCRRARPARSRSAASPTTPIAISPTTAASKSTAAAASAPATSACSIADGFLCLTGREKELIIRGGVNISPLEIDSFLMQRPELIEVATVGVPDAIYGEEVVSYVVARPGTTIDTGELLRFCSDGAAGLQGAEADRGERVAAQDRARQARPQGAGGAVASQNANGRASRMRSESAEVRQRRTRPGMREESRARGASPAAHARHEPDVRYRPVLASECTQPCMRDLTFSMSFLVKKSSGFTLSTG